MVVIHNFEQKQLIENFLILNQKKLLDRLIELFELESSDLENVINFLNQQNIIDFINEQKFINFSMFVSLINLDTCFLYKNNKIKSLHYLIKKKSINLLNFLLDLNQQIYPINWKLNLKNSQLNILDYIFKKLYWNEKIILKILDTKYFQENQMYKSIDNKNKSLFWLVTKCDETSILKAIELNILDFNWKDSYSNKLIHWACKKNYEKLFNYLVTNKIDLEQPNLSGKKPIHLTCIKNNIKMVKLLIDCNVCLESIDNDLKKPIDYAIKYGNSELVYLLIDKHIELKNNIIYDVIDYQDKNVFENFLNKDLINISESYFIWIVSKLILKKYYSQIYKYTSIKINYWIKNYLGNLPNFYIDGHYIGDDNCN